MAERPRFARRGLVLAAYATATGLLLDAVARDLPWLGRRLARAAQLLPEPVRPAEPSLTVAVVAIAAFAALLGLGSFLVSRRTGTGFGLLAVATVTWLAFPYARVPWARVLGAPSAETYTAPASVWLLAGTVVALATVEMTACAHGRVIAELEVRGLAPEPGSSLEQATNRAHRHWQLATLAAGTAIVLLFALLRPVTERLAGGLDLLWVPALAGLVAGAALWLWAHR